MGRIFAHPLTPWIAFSLALTACLLIPLALGRSVPEGIFAIAGFANLVLAIFWLRADARRRGKPLFFDYGFIAALFFPVTVVWYCFSTRGWRGIFLLSLLAALWLAPYLIAVVTWTLIYGAP